MALGIEYGIDQTTCNRNIRLLSFFFFVCVLAFVWNIKIPTKRYKNKYLWICFWGDAHLDFFAFVMSFSSSAYYRFVDDYILCCICFWWIFSPCSRNEPDNKLNRLKLVHNLWLAMYISVVCIFAGLQCNSSRCTAMKSSLPNPNGKRYHCTRTLYNFRSA